MAIDKKTIYQNLREEIIDLTKRQDNYMLASYTICITIWAFALENSNEWVAILPIFILIPLSLRVSDFRYGGAFLSAYMTIFLEEKSYNGWEYVREEYYKIKEEFHLNKNDVSMEQLQLFKSRSFLLSILSRGTFVLLTLISVVIFWAIHGIQLKPSNNLITIIIVGFVQSLVLGLQCYVAYKYRDTTAIKKSLLNDWEYVYVKMHVNGSEEAVNEKL